MFCVRCTISMPDYSSHMYFVKLTLIFLTRAIRVYVIFCGVLDYKILCSLNNRASWNDNHGTIELRVKGIWRTKAKAAAEQTAGVKTDCLAFVKNEVKIWWWIKESVFYISRGLSNWHSYQLNKGLIFSATHWFQHSHNR